MLQHLLPCSPWPTIFINAFKRPLGFHGRFRFDVSEQPLKFLVISEELGGCRQEMIELGTGQSEIGGNVRELCMFFDIVPLHQVQRAASSDIVG